MNNYDINQVVDSNYSTKDCINDWIIINWAWEVDI